ncbi:hypothetical protein MIZ01_1391 [Sideroxyarcus emersonii]|uniref:Diguanylate cyclase n=1 Tax=Sideroxyarcus emersonii TaxID=2764705 RepID=A0AAN1XA35_9PROT|nr:sensor domain-containing diguanylate cyclase [Sideroxyarcus emersonii]BCK87600.1 hypothetical protein MIZ01_1391 [Sideroxyarcus emersonii]
MGDSLENLRHELEVSRHALAEAEERYARLNAEGLAAADEFENARKQIERVKQEWMAALDVVEAPIFLHDRDFHVLRCNRAYQQCAGLPYSEIIGRRYFEVFPKTHAPLRNCLQSLEKKIEAGHEEEVEFGDQVFRSRAYTVNDELGAYLYSVHILEDVTERRQAAEALAANEKKFRELVESLSDWVWEVDEQGRYTYCSPRVKDMLGYDPEELLGKSPFDLMPSAEAAKVRDIFASHIAARKPLKCLENTNRHKNGHLLVLETSGTPIFDADGKFKGYRGIDRDITDRKRLEQELEYQAHTDVLTGLHNRRHFFELAEQELARSKRYGKQLSLLMLDVDQFKILNDTYGHHVGDLVLQKLSQICAQTLREIDIAGRIGGEEFAILLPETRSDHAQEVAERLRVAIAGATVPQESGGFPVQFTVSIGVTSLVAADTQIDEMLRRADVALYVAKEAGRNRVCTEEVA